MHNPWTLVAFVAAGLVIISLWMWMNVMLVRKMQAAESPRRPADAGTSAESSDSKPPEPPQRDAELEQTPSVGDKGFAAASEVESETRTGGAPAEPVVRDPEVYSDEGLDKGKVFGRSGMPFYVRKGLESPFADAEWTRVFHMLKRDSRVLGWIVFQEDCMAAADHEYDDALVQVLMNYRASLENLRKEVGLSKIAEASLIGDEGKMWFVAVSQDIWFTLFLDRAVEVDDILEPLLKPALQDSST